MFSFLLISFDQPKKDKSLNFIWFVFSFIWIETKSSSTVSRCRERVEIQTNRRQGKRKWRIWITRIEEVGDKRRTRQKYNVKREKKKEDVNRWPFHARRSASIRHSHCSVAGFDSMRLSQFEFPLLTAHTRTHAHKKVWLGLFSLPSLVSFPTEKKRKKWKQPKK